VHFFHTFFYVALYGGQGIYNYESVKSWTAKLPYRVHKCDKIVVPMHHPNGVHWVLVVCDIAQGRIRYLDSLGGPAEHGELVGARAQPPNSLCLYL